MKTMRFIEITVGLFMAAGFVAIFFLAMQVSNLSITSSDKTFSVTASFENVGGLKVRAPITMAGVRIGRVSSIVADKSTFEAIVTLDIDTEFDQIPDDTFAKIYTAGLLGEQYIGLDPGGSEDYISEGSTLEMTQSALVLEELISKFMFDKAEQNAFE